MEACPKHSKLKGGSTAVIVIFSLFFGYLLLGTLVKHNQGANGYDKIPHSELWCGIVGFFAYGCSSLVGGDSTHNELDGSVMPSPAHSGERVAASGNTEKSGLLGSNV
jgi:hypothetical protein